ncbi:MAG: pyridoxal 5'-phosphate synthase glutaminase subunit PdxT [Candidatus Solibacter usitatus]|nr:pyridoxal 5'-phosphate synthase glutaminase subunit PdxT [Candidatus Solibacter usitatus]
MNVGVLALQGDFEAHAGALQRAGARVIEVRHASELDVIDGLVIPGGESTSMLRLMEYYGLVEPLRRFGARQPVFGTCAGAILMATEVLNPPQASLGLVDMAVQRNAYGRQLDSRVARLSGHALGGDEEIEAVFIRAPIIRRLGEGAVVLATYEGNPVLVESGLHLAATFHPELSAGSRIHRRFLEKIESCAG